MSLVETFPADRIIRDLAARDKKSAIKELLQFLVEQGSLTEDAAKKAEKAVQKRESVGSTGIGKGLAIPHAKDCSFVDSVVGVFARSVHGLGFEAVDGGLVHVIFLVLSPVDGAESHLNLMKRIALLHRAEKTLQYIAKDEKLENLHAIFKEVDEEFV